MLNQQSHEILLQATARQLGISRRRLWSIWLDHGDLTPGSKPQSGEASLSLSEKQLHSPTGDASLKIGDRVQVEWAAGTEPPARILAFLYCK